MEVEIFLRGKGAGLDGASSQASAEQERIVLVKDTSLVPNWLLASRPVHELPSSSSVRAFEIMHHCARIKLPEWKR